MKTIRCSRKALMAIRPKGVRPEKAKFIRVNNMDGLLNGLYAFVGYPGGIGVTARLDNQQAASELGGAYIDAGKSPGYWLSVTGDSGISVPHIPKGVPRQNCITMDNGNPSVICCRTN